MSRFAVAAAVVVLGVMGCLRQQDAEFVSGTQATVQQAAAQQSGTQAAQQACASPDHRMLDFWVGSWDLTWPGGQGGTPTGETGRGTNEITLELGDCVIHENFSGAGFDGQSFSIYEAATSTWRQTWVDNSGGHIALTGGKTDDGNMYFQTAPATGPSGGTSVSRMIWEDVTQDAMTWRWQSATTADGPWNDQWVISYKRRGS